jgi:preprotein translocase subunit YajC
MEPFRFEEIVLTTFELLAQALPSTLPSVAPSGAAQTASPAAPMSGTPTSTTTAPGSTHAPVPPPDEFLLLKQVVPIVLMVAVFLLIVNRSKKKETQSREQMLSKLKKGDEVQTIGGILGKVMDAREDRVLVKVDENSNTKIWFSRTAIHRVVGAEEEAK